MKQPEETVALSPASVLVVDDDLTTRMLICESIRSVGFRVHEADDGSKGLEMFQTLDPNLVLLDVVMPNMDGFEACTEIRQLPGGDRVPILMATGLDDMDSIRRAYEAGATDFITKPINWLLLGHRVRYMIRSGQTYEKLRRSLHRNRALLDAMPDAMIRYKTDGSILESTLGTDSPIVRDGVSLVGRDIMDMVPRDYAVSAIQAGCGTISEDSTQQVEFTYPPNKKTARDYEARIVVSGENEVLAIVRDITDRRRMEKTLQASEKRFRSLIENALDLITLVQTDGIILYESPAVSRMLGYEADALVGTNIFQLAAEEDVELLRGVMDGAGSDSNPASRVEQVRMRTADGAWRIMETICTLFEDESSETSVIVINSRDVTERVETEKALKNSEEQLLQSQKMEAIGRLAGGVAHDFNNLLTAILGYGQLLEDRLIEEGIDTEESQEIRKAATRATALTRQLLAFSRKQVMQTKVLNLNGIVEDIEKMLRRLLGEDVNLVCAVDPDLDRVNVDPSQMEQVILNLSVNARDAMPGGGALTIATKNFHVDTDFLAMHSGVNEGKYVMLSVTDTGTGMDEETKARIFEPFFTTKEDGKGTGLGLATVYGIVNQSEGHIWVDSDVGVGTTFNVLIPMSEEQDNKRPEYVQPRQGVRGTETILLVEDEDWVRALVKKCLERYGYTVLIAEHGKHALNVAANFKNPIDLMLTDVVMPHMNGVDLAHAISPRRPDMRVVFMSGYTDHAIVNSGVLDFEKSFLQKPFTLEAVAKKIRDALDEPAVPIPEL